MDNSQKTQKQRSREAEAKIETEKQRIRANITELERKIKVETAKLNTTMSLLNFVDSLQVRLLIILISALSVCLGYPFFLGFAIVMLLFAINDTIREIKKK